MTDHVFIPFNGTFLALTRHGFVEALELGAQLVAPAAESPSSGHEQWLTVDQVAARTGVSRSYWYEACRTGECPNRRFGTAVRIPVSFLDDIEEQSIGH